VQTYYCCKINDLINKATKQVISNQLRHKFTKSRFETVLKANSVAKNWLGA